MKQAVPILAALAVVGAFSTAVYAQTAGPRDQVSPGHHAGPGLAHGHPRRHGERHASLRQGRRHAQREVRRASCSTCAGKVSLPARETGAPTRAKPEIWKDKAKFDKYAQDAKAESVKFAAAAGNGLDALRAAIGPMGRACNNCHDDFQNKDLSK